MGGCQGTLVCKLGNLQNSVSIPLPMNPNQVPDGNISNPVQNVVDNLPNPIIRFTKNVEILGVPRFTYEYLKHVTEDFTTTVLGKGSYGTVYEGTVGDTKLAVKMRSPLNVNEGNIEWKREVNYLWRLDHPNIVKIVGFCSEDEIGTLIEKHRGVVYEHMANGSLEEHIYPGVTNPLPWLRRVKIALDVAKGLAFIHNAPNPIIHRNLKTTDILLDEMFNAKISDFGCAKEGPIVQATKPPHSKNGREGYLDPNYVETGLASNKTDVYSFGVILLELIAGRPVIESSPSPKKNLVIWGRKMLKDKNKKMLLKFIDAKMGFKFPPPSIEQVLKVAYTCLHIDPKKRPNMEEIIKNLHSVIANDTESGASDEEISPYESPV